jgi:hypothetical protein
MSPKSSTAFLCLTLCLGCNDGGSTSTDSGTDSSADVTNDGTADVIEEPADDPVAEPTPDGTEDVESETGECTAAGPVDVTLTTEDGVELIAQFYTPGVVGAPGVILLHEYPLYFTMASYPATFITNLTDRGFNVINVNRRGATGSGGVVEDAFWGPLGKWDARAGYDYLVSHSCTTTATAIGVVGASNGTTTAVDFSVWAASDAAAEQPAVLVFLSGDTYTESQNTLSGSMDALDNHPILFVYPAAEAAWNNTIEALPAPETWEFQEYSGEAHGTALFSAHPDSIGRVGDFLDATL